MLQLHRVTTAFWKTHTQTLMLSASISIFFETHKLSVPSFGCRKKSVNVFKVQYEIPPLPQELSGKIFPVPWGAVRFWKCFMLRIRTIHQHFETPQGTEIQISCHRFCAAKKFHSCNLETLCSYVKHLIFEMKMSKILKWKKDRFLKTHQFSYFDN